MPPRRATVPTGWNRYADLNLDNQNPFAAALPTYQDDYFSPYFLHKSENPGAVLVTTLLSGSGNYHSWSRAMLIALDAKNKTTLIDGSLPRSSSGDLLFPAWKYCNNMVKSWLLNSVSMEFSNSLLSFRDTVEIWNDLRSDSWEVMVQEFLPFKKRLANLNQGAMDVNSYYTKMKVLWDKLVGYEDALICACPVLNT